VSWGQICFSLAGQDYKNLHRPHLPLTPLRRRFYQHSLSSRGRAFQADARGVGEELPRMLLKSRAELRKLSVLASRDDLKVVVTVTVV
jgi:hypothetical protein